MGILAALDAAAGQTSTSTPTPSPSPPPVDLGAGYIFNQQNPGGIAVGGAPSSMPITAPPSTTIAGLKDYLASQPVAVQKVAQEFFAVNANQPAQTTPLAVGKFLGFQKRSAFQ